MILRYRTDLRDSIEWRHRFCCNKHLSKKKKSVNWGFVRVSHIVPFEAITICNIIKKNFFAGLLHFKIKAKIRYFSITLIYYSFSRIRITISGFYLIDNSLSYVQH